MIRNYFITSVRNLQKQKTFSFINIFGLAVGFTVSLLILLWIIDELSYDQFHLNKNNLYRVVVEQQDAGGRYLSAITQFPLAEALKSEFPEIVNATRYFGYNSPQIIKYRDRIAKIDNIGYADGSFLEMFSYALESGDRSTALDNPNSIILSKTEALNYFGDKNPVGEIVFIDFFGDQKEFMVTGVLASKPGNSHIAFNALIPFHVFNPLYEGQNLWNTANNYFTYLQLGNNLSYKTVNEKISDFLSGYIPENKDKLFLQPVTDIHLTTNIKFDSPTNVSSNYIYFFGIISAFVIFIACINFMNLSTARAERRAKEIGLRKVIGANKKQIIAQFLGESFLLIFIALVVSLLLVEISLPVFNNLAGKTVTLSSIITWKIFGLFIIIVVSTSLLAGSYPALFLSSFNPVDVIRRKSFGLKDGRNFRKVLVIIQFTLSTILIVSTLVVSEQLNFIHSIDLGIEKENIIHIQIPRSSRAKYESIKNELKTIPGVLNVAVSNILPIHGNESNFSEWDGNVSNKNVLFNISTVGYDYFSTLGIDLAEGRFFSNEFPSDLEDACIVNEEAVRQMEMDNPIGKKIHGSRIVGVVKDYHYMSLHNNVDPIFLRCAPQNAQFVYVKINANNYSEIINRIENVFYKYIPDSPFDYHFLDETIDNLYKVEMRSRVLFTGFTFIAIIISSLGLLGLIIFMVEKRTREIGIRKVLGASIAGIGVLLTSEFIKLIAIANIIACPVAYFLMNSWLDNFALRINFNPLLFIVSWAIVVSIAFLTIGAHVLKAASANPVKSLKYE